MVSLYNDLLALMDNFTAEKSDTEMSGYLAEDTAITRFLKTKIRSAIFGDSSTGSGNIMAMRDIGVNIDQNGNIKFSEADYDAAIAASYDDVVIMLTGGTSNENLFTVSNKGLAQDVATVLSDFIDSTGVVTVRETGSKSELSDHEEELAKFEIRMENIYKRYLSQFGAMETLMATLDSTKDYLTSQFESLSKAYDVD